MTVERLVRLLAGSSDLDAVQIADLLWLAHLTATAPGEPAQPAVPDAAGETTAPISGTGGPLPATNSLAPAPDGAAAPAAEPPPTVAAFEPPVRRPRNPRIALPQALRQLKRFRQTGTERSVDIATTVEVSANASLAAGRRRLFVVTEGRPERTLNLALITDAAPTMSPWEETITRLGQLAAQLGAFRTITRWELIAGHDQVLLRDSRGFDHLAGRLTDPTGNTLVLLATDALAPYWYRQPVWTALEAWASVMPIALLQVLPQRYWSSTALADPSMTARAARPLSPNDRFQTRPQWWAPPTEGTIVPVVALRPDLLDRWATALVTGGAWADGVAAVRPAAPRTPTSPDVLMDAFHARASPGAENLARLASFAPFVTIPLLAEIQHRLLPGTGPTELSELLASGLLPTAPDGRPHFPDEIRDRLQQGATALEEWDVAEALAGFATAHPSEGLLLRSSPPNAAAQAAGRSLTTDPVMADALLDLDNIGSARGLGPPDATWLERLTLTVEALARRIGRDHVAVYPIVGRAFAHRERRSPLAHWISQGLIEESDLPDDRLLDLAELTGLPIVSGDLFRDHRGNHPWLNGSEEAVLWPRPDGPDRIELAPRDLSVPGDPPAPTAPPNRREINRRLADRRWRCPREGCPHNAPNRWILLPVLRHGSPVCDLHDLDLVDEGPRPALAQLVLLVDGHEVHRTAVTTGHPLPVGRAPGPGGLDLSPWVAPDRRLLRRRHFTLEIGEGRLTITDHATDFTAPLPPRARIEIAPGIELARAGLPLPAENPRLTAPADHGPAGPVGGGYRYYHLPSILADYLPDPLEPVDRWLQTPDSPNAGTVARVIRDLCGPGRNVDYIIDPFAGSGGVAMAARVLAVPFYGLEPDPVLACACLAKLSAGRAQDDYLDVVLRAREHLSATGRGGSLTLDAIEADLMTAARLVPGSRVICADPTDPAAWDALSLPSHGHAVVYISRSAQRRELFELPEHLGRFAADRLRFNGALIDHPAPEPGPDHLETIERVLRFVADRVESATLIVEHEPDDLGSDSRFLLYEFIQTLGRRTSNLFILETRAFSRQGMFSFVTGELD